MAEPAVVLGGADSVWDDLAALEELIGRQWPGIFIAANDIAVHFPRRLDHLVSMHPEKIEGWKRQRIDNGLPGACTTWVRRGKSQGRADREITHWGGGASGLLAVAVAYAIDCPRVVLCGVPMDARPHFSESNEHDPTEKWTAWESHRTIWGRKRERIVKRTRSMSGWTKELLGAPTPEWLGLDAEAA